MTRRTILLVLVLLALAPLMGAAGEDVRIVVISDLNDAYGSTTYGPQVHEAMAYIAKQRPDLVICAGDMVAGQNLKLTEETFRAMWKGFDEAILRRLNGLCLPFAFTFGNHDGPSTETYARERRIAGEFWASRRPPLDFVDDSRYPHAFSFECRGLFFATIDASTARIDPAQREWLKRQFASERARSARLRVVLGHLPLFAIAEGRNGPGNVVSDADSLHELFCTLGVDYYISGHHHAFYPSAKGRLKMLSAGALGGGPRRLLGSDRPPARTVTTLSFRENSHSFQVVTHDLTNGMNLLETADLPMELHGFNGVSRRFDGGEPGIGRHY